MTNTYRTRVLYVRDGADAYHGGNTADLWGYEGKDRHARSYFNKANRRKQRRQARRADAAALAVYYEDMDWLAKFDAEIIAREEECYYGEDWNRALEEWDWRDYEAEQEADDDSFDDLYDPYDQNNWPLDMVPDYGWESWEGRYSK